jgi:KipI family sensor histidine kinase inhibitor
LRFLPAGPTAVLIEVDDLDEVFSLTAEIDRHRRNGWGPAIVDVVPGATTVLVDGVTDPDRVVHEIAGWSLPPANGAFTGTVKVLCRYDGPDLGDVARVWGVTEAEAVEVHSSLRHRVAFCGFSPGFAYIAGLGERWQVPRRPSPRPAVPTGSVALGGMFTGIYPRCSPAGWQVIGHTDVALWDPGRDPPALLAPGAAVRFVAA